MIVRDEGKFYCKITDTAKKKCMGISKGRIHTKMPPYVYGLFKNYFRELNQQFFHAIGEDFGWNDYFKLDEEEMKHISNVN